MSAILFGSIGTIADTSELQREAFNQAFEQHGLSWHWDRAEYLALLERSGGEQRIADYARSAGDEVDAGAVHAAKSELFRARMAEGGLTPREGVVDTVREAREQGFKVALVTTTSADNVVALLAAVGPELTENDFDLVVDSSDVDEPKPAAAAYRFALERLGEAASGCVAVEDNLNGVDAANSASVACVAFPNANTTGHEFARADARVERLAFSELQARVAAA